MATVAPSTRTGRLRRIRSGLTRREWAGVAGMVAAVVGLHVVGWMTLLALVVPHHYSLGTQVFGVGIGVTAYTLGLRHAFDADHIAAIDNTTRKMLADGKRPLGVGFFFSLGHSTVVFSLAAGLAVAASRVKSQLPGFSDYGSWIGAGVSGTFLWIIGILNLLVLLDIVRIFFAMRRGSYDKAKLEERLLDRGFMNRFYIGRFANRIKASWQMYPLGVLFGLGFDTATEVGVLALAAGVATHQVPFLALLRPPS